MEFGNTLLAAVQGIARVLLVVLTGALVQARTGMFGAGLKGLTQLLFRLLLPCLLFVSVSRAISVSFLATLVGTSCV